LRFNGETFLHYISALSNGRIFDLSLQYSALKSSLRPFFTDFVNFAHYAFHLNKLDDYPAYKAQKIGELSFLTFCYWFIFISLVIATHNLNKSYQRFAPGFIAAILLSLWGLCIPTASWAGHHVIYVIPFIFIWTLFSLRKIYEYRPTLGTLYFATLCVLGISPLFTLSKYEPLAEFNSSNRRVLEFINESGLSKTAFIFSPNWGFFDFPFIYGSPETRIADFDIGFSDQNHQLYRNMINGTEKARQEAIILKRSLLLVSLEGKEQSFNSFFPREAYPDFVRIQVPGVKDEGYRWALWLLKDPAQAKIDQKKINKRLL
jgi:hypothetical protein